MIDSAVKSIFDLFRPKVLGLLFGIPFLALALWLALGWFLTPFLQGWLAQALVAWDLQQIFQDAGAFVLVLLLLILLFPLVYWTSLILMSILALPYILKFLRARYPLSFTPQGSGIVSGWSSMVKVFAIAVPLYIGLLFFIWLPMVYAVGTFILGAWVNYHFLSLEILSEFVGPAKAKELLRQNRTELWIMGGGLVFLLGVPFIQLITPVFAGLWFSHWWLKKLSSLRDAG